MEKTLNQILLEVLMNYTKHSKIRDLLSVQIIFFWIGLLGAISR